MKESKLVSEWMKQQFINRIIEKSKFVEMLKKYAPPDTRSWYKKLWDSLYWRTIERFKSWLHRDCDY